MNKDQVIHIGMVNSFNLLTERFAFQDIAMSGIAMFAHTPDEDISAKELDHIIIYFQEIEMFEYCAELLDYRKKNFNEDGSMKVKECECKFPSIKEYKLKSTCSACKKRLVR